MLLQFQGDRYEGRSRSQLLPDLNFTLLGRYVDNPNQTEAAIAFLKGITQPTVRFPPQGQHETSRGDKQLRLPSVSRIQRLTLADKSAVSQDGVA